MSFVLLEREEIEKLHERMDEMRVEAAILEQRLATLEQRNPWLRCAAEGLSHAELRVLVMVAQGYGYRQVAARYHVSERTIRQHVTLMLRKLGLENRVQLARYAWRQGIVCPDEAWATVERLKWRPIKEDV
jgi:DNA-binding NarL/FixJ family response regulator